MAISHLKEWRDAYDYLTLHIVPGPRSWIYFVPFIALPMILMVPSSKLSVVTIRIVFLPVLVAVQVLDWVQNQSFDVISMNHVLMMFMLLGWYDVREDFKHITARSETSEQYRSETYPEQLWPRLQWIGLLVSSLRLTDWHIGSRSHDRQQPAPFHPVRPFFLNTLAHSMLSYVILIYTQGSTICTTQFPLAFLVRLYALLALYNSLLPTLIVLCFIIPLGLQSNSKISPLTWHNHFGSFNSIYTEGPVSGLRAFWGVFWHQNMRYLTSTPGVALASWLNLDGTTRYMIVVISSFFWSGIVHMGVIPAEPLHGSSLQLRLQLAAFFWLQPLGIGIEMSIRSVIAPLAENTRPSSAGSKQARHLLYQATMLCWTCRFLAVTAAWTIQPVGCTMGWWQSPFLSAPRPQWLVVGV